MLGLALAITVVLTAGWEAVLRARGYEPSLDDSPDLWALARARVGERSLVLVGDSRTLFDLDLDELERGLGARPVQLATVGTNPLFMLEHLAGDEDFRGTVITGFSPHLFFVPPGANEDAPRKGLERFRHGSLAQEASFYLFRPLDRHLVLFNSRAFDLRSLIKQIRLPQREGVDDSFVPYTYTLDDERQARMRMQVVTDPAFRDQIRNVWVGRRKPPPMDLAARAAREGDRHVTLWRAHRAVSRIRARGGRVVFVHLPSSGALREREDQVRPRAAHWDALLAVTQAPGIHWLDHPELAGFVCPEWSHLSAADSPAFTRRLVPLLRQHLRLR